MSLDEQMKNGSGIAAECGNCGTRRELTLDEVTCAPTPAESATKVLEAEGWDVDRTWCRDCVVKEADEKQAASLAKANEKEAEDARKSRPPGWTGSRLELVDDEDTAEVVTAEPSPNDLDFELGKPPAPARVEPEPEEEFKPEPIVIFEEKDIRIVMTTDKFDGPPEEILIVERAHSEKDAMGKTRYTSIGLMHTVWVIQELARALFERDTGRQDSPPQTRVWLGSGRYIPLPNVID